MSFQDEGYLLQQGAYSPAEVEALNANFDKLWTAPNDKMTIDVIPTGERRMLKGAPESVRLAPYKINDVYLESPTLRRLIAKLGPQVESILGSKGCIINSLHFERGSEQGLHTDLFYLPGRQRGGMTAAWIALEDIDAESGPLVYFPGSHRIEPPFSYWDVGPDERMARSEEAMKYYFNRLGPPEHNTGMKAGDVFFWHEALIHGGDKITNEALTRRSIVVHFWRANDMCGQVFPINSALSWFHRPHQKPTTTSPWYTKDVA